mmetsp:Transcript_65635/g.97200  ORF Transcript_65635/g.97200 Transcript_65635/m.97200 type:complete len:871 (+) Transcript_65635:150-2762(+)
MTPNTQTENGPASANTNVKISPDTVPSKKLPNNDNLLSLSFNQDGGCLAVGTSYGFRICNVHPFQETFRRDFRYIDAESSNSSDKKEDTETKSESNTKRGTGIGRVAMLHRTNILALVGGGQSPRYSPRRVIIYDDHLSKTTGELSFQRRVLNVKLRRDRICVALVDCVSVYNFSDYKLLDTIHTCDNELGLMDINTDPASVDVAEDESPTAKVKDGKKVIVKGGDLILACPGASKGQVKVELYGQCKSVLIEAHDIPLGALALTKDGSLLATTCENGTIIRLFDTGATSMSTNAGSLLQKFRRGKEHAVVSCLAFSPEGCFLSCASDRGTVHLFRVSTNGEYAEDSVNKPDVPNGTGTNYVSRSVDIIKSAPMAAGRLVLLPKKLIMEGEESFAQVRDISNPRICAFVPNKPKAIAIVGVDEFGNASLTIASFNIDSAIVEKNECYHFFRKNHEVKRELNHKPNSTKKVPKKKHADKKKVTSKYINNVDSIRKMVIEDMESTTPTTVGSKDIVIAMVLVANGYVTYVPPPHSSYYFTHVIFVSIFYTITWICIVVAVNKGDKYFDKHWKEVLIKYGYLDEEDKIEEDDPTVVEGYAVARESQVEGDDKNSRLKKLCPESTPAERERFLAARNGDTSAAAEQLGSYLRWRSLSKIDELFASESTGEERENGENEKEETQHTITSPSISDEEIWKISARGATSIEKDGQAAADARVPQIVFSNSIDSSDGGKMTKKIIHVLPGRLDLGLASPDAYAQAVAIFLEKKQDRESLEKIDIVIDVRGAKGWANPKPTAVLPFVKTVSSLLGSNFPERLDRCILFPLPRVMSPLWNMARKFLDEDTANKIHVCFGGGGHDDPIPSSVGQHLDQKNY